MPSATAGHESISASELIRCTFVNRLGEMVHEQTSAELHTLKRATSVRLLFGTAMLVASHLPAMANWYVLRLPDSRACKIAEVQPGAIIEGELLMRQPSRDGAIAKIIELQGKGICAPSASPSETPPQPSANK